MNIIEFKIKIKQLIHFLNNVREKQKRYHILFLIHTIFPFKLILNNICIVDKKKSSSKDKDKKDDKKGTPKKSSGVSDKKSTKSKKGESPSGKFKYLKS